MFFHNLKFILRNLKRNVGHTLINVLGLSLGLLAAFVIFLKLRHDLTFNHHLPDTDRIYRVVLNEENKGDMRYSSGLPGPLHLSLRSDFPHFQAMTVVDRTLTTPIISLTDEERKLDKFKEEWATRVWPNFFEFISYEWIQGNAETALQNPQTCVLTRSIALKIFGTVDAIGKVISIDKDKEYTVMGVVEDPPLSTSFPFKLYLSAAAELIPEGLSDEWHVIPNYIQCFVKLAPDVSPKYVESLFPFLIHNHAPEGQIDTSAYKLFLQPLNTLHVDTRYRSFGKPVASKTTLWALAFIGFFLLLTACINFVNLNVALIFKRTKEAGLRKVLGSRKPQIFRFFLLETAIIVFASVTLTAILLPFTLKQTEFLLREPLQFFPFADPYLWFYLGSFFLLVLVLAGFYPSWLLSKVNPLTALKDRVYKGQGNKFSLSKGLLIIQFAISQLLIICTLAMMEQMDFFHNSPLGFEKNAVLEVSLPEGKDPTQAELETLRTKLIQFASISSVSFSNLGASANGHWKTHVNKSGSSQIKWVDPYYLETYKINLIEGEAFSSWDTIPEVLLNQAFLKKFVGKLPHEVIGNLVEIGGKSYVIKGVTEDYHTESFHKPIEPLAMFPSPQHINMCAMKLKGGNVHEIMPYVRKVYKDTYPEELPEVQFLDAKLARLYESELRTTRLFQISALTSIFIGLLGLLGLVSLAANSRIKEIGIRKVLGATLSNIISLFTKEFLGLVILGFLVAVPIAWFLMNRWLENFAYRISLGVGIFVLAFMLSLLLMLVIVGLRSYKSASINPVEAIRNE